MKTLNLLFLILIGITISSCSSDDNNETSTPEPNESIIVYKKANSFNNSTLSSFQEVFYNSNKKVNKVITNIDNGWKIKTLDIIYNGNEITKITTTTDFGNSNDNDTFEEYDVITDNNQITLSESNGIDSQIKIDFTNEYVDSYKLIQPSNMNIIQEEIFTRNSDNNIVSHTGVENMVFNYSNYDLGNVMPFHREYSFDYFIVFELKVSKKLPLTEEVIFSSGGSSSSSIDPSLFSYDNNNNIINYGDDTNYIEFEYIEL